MVLAQEGGYNVESNSGLATDLRKCWSPQMVVIVRESDPQNGLNIQVKDLLY